MRISRKTVILVLAGLFLVGAVGLQGVRMRDVHRGDMTSPVQPISLAEKLPGTLAGWSVSDEPLGATESVRSAVARTLNYDDYVFRSYTRGDTQFAVYVAYWTAGRMPMEKVASHTPDRCWSENGWSCNAMRYPEILDSEAGRLKPAYWRIFTPPSMGPKQYVLYWHLVGDELYDYGGGFNQRLSVLRWWSDMLRYAFTGSQEQFFIRLTSTRPFEELRGDAGFEAVVAALARLGLSSRQQ